MGVSILETLEPEHVSFGFQHNCHFVSEYWIMSRKKSQEGHGHPKLAKAFSWRL